MINRIKWLLKNFKQSVCFSDDISPYDLFFIHPQLMVIVSFVNLYCHNNKLEFKITSAIRTESQDKKLGAVSSSHQEGRSVDFSLQGFKKSQIEELRHEINTRYSDIGAVSSSNGLSRPIVIHDNGNGYHAHLQVRPNL